MFELERSHLHVDRLAGTAGELASDRHRFVGAPILHGYSTSSGPQGTGGASRVAAAAAPLVGAGGPSDTAFFLWLVVIGVVIPVLIVGGLKVGGFQFVFKRR